MKNFRFEIVEDVLYLHVNDGYYLPQRIRVASKKDPIVFITTNNVDERIVAKYLPKLKGAKKLIDEIRPNYDEDPYGNKVVRGTRPYQKWDLSEVFNN